MGSLVADVILEHFYVSSN